MKTRLLGAAVLVALMVLFVPMFFSSTPPTPGGDQAVNLAIPPAPDRDLQTRTMSLTPDQPAGAVTAANATPVSSDQLATDGGSPHKFTSPGKCVTRKAIWKPQVKNPACNSR